MQFFRNTNFDFQGKRRIAFVFSALLLVIGIASIIFHGGPRLSIDFKGGLSMRLQFENTISEADVRAALTEIGIGSSEVKTIREMGGNAEILIRVKADEAGANTQEVITNELNEYFVNNSFQVRSVEKVGARIGEELAASAVLAIVVTLLLILFYLSWRFEFKFGVGAVVALFHDVLIVLGLFSLLNLEISLSIVAAFLTIVGYSLNDTIVVYDRIRENLKKHSSSSMKNIINLSINETLSRTIVTSGTTLVVVLMLLLFGGIVIKDFAFALFAGVIVGTYSSIYIASPILLEWGKREALLKKKKAR